MASTGKALLDLLRQQKLVLAVMLTVLLLASVNWMLSPDQALRWFSAMSVLPGLWLAMALWHLWTLRSLRRRSIDDESAVTRYFGSALALIFIAIGLRQTVMFGLEIWLAVGNHPTDLDVERRILGLASCAVFIIIGNALPKILTPLAMLPREQAELVTVARRFIGMAFVFMGSVTAVVYLAMPLELARALLMFATIASVPTILGAVVWMNLAAARRKR
jgi:hypothetical protein